MMRTVNLGSFATALTVYATASTDFPNIQKNYSCIRTSGSALTLDRNWEGSNGSFFQYTANLAGWGEQPYMLGIKLNYPSWLQSSSNSTLVSGYAAIRSLSSGYVFNTGYDSNTLGLNYGTSFQWCYTPTTATPGTVMFSRTPGCNQGLDPASIRASRVVSAEASSALRAYFDSQNGSAGAISWGDTVYGAEWGFCPWTLPGYFCDTNYLRDEVSDASLTSYKWPGFFFGMGMSHQWPAVRVSAFITSSLRMRFIGNNLQSGNLYTH
jgi:hypothetical protein